MRIRIRNSLPQWWIRIWICRNRAGRNSGRRLVRSRGILMWSYLLMLSLVLGSPKEVRFSHSTVFFFKMIMWLFVFALHFGYWPWFKKKWGISEIEVLGEIVVIWWIGNLGFVYFPLSFQQSNWVWKLWLGNSNMRLEWRIVRFCWSEMGLGTLFSDNLRALTNVNGFVMMFILE